MFARFVDLACGIYKTAIVFLTMRRRLSLTVLCVALALTECTLMAPQQPQYVDRAVLLRESASKLRMAEVFELSHVGADRTTSIDGPQGAFDGYYFGAQATESEVYAYYAGELTKSGWIPDRIAAIMGSVELKAWGWCKDAMNYRLGIQDQPRAFKPEFYQGRQFTTVFNAEISSREPDLKCPLSR